MSPLAPSVHPTVFDLATPLYSGLISHFPIDFCMGLITVQRYCAACDKYTLTTLFAE